MPVDLAQLVGGGRAAIITMELQRGVVGDLSSFPELADAVAKERVIENTARLCSAARAVHRPVVHCTAGFRADRSGSPANAPLIGSLLRRPSHLVEGSAAVELVPALGFSEKDLISHRSHGVSPFTGTELDSILRALGISTVVAAGVSLNLGIPGLAIEAVNLGYHVVVPADAVTGVPPDYAGHVLRNTLSLVARLATVDEIVDVLG